MASRNQSYGGGQRGAGGGGGRDRQQFNRGGGPRDRQQNNRDPGGFRGGGGGGYAASRNVPPRPTRDLQIVKMPPNENKSKFVGKSGKQTQVVVNYFKMRYNNGMKIHRYRVDYFIHGENDIRKEIVTKRRLAHRERFWNFVREHEEFFKGRHNLVYDDSHMFYSIKSLDIDGDIAELTITEQAERDNEQLIMQIKPAGVLAIQFDEDGFRVLNMILTQCARCPIDRLRNTIHCEISRMYMLNRAIHMPLDLDGFQMFRGLYSFAKQGLMHGQAFANFDVTHSAFYKMDLPVLQFYTFAKTGQFLSADQQLQLREYGMDRRQRQELKTLLNGIKLKKIKRHPDMVESEATFCDVINRSSDAYRFPSTEYGEVTVREYYRRRYNYELRYPTMPLIQIMPRERNLMIPIELLKISDRMQRLRRKLPDTLQALTNQFTTTPPAQRFSDIDQMSRDECLIMDDPFLDNFGVGVDPRFLEIGARVLTPPNCMFSNSFPAIMRMTAVEGPQKEGRTIGLVFDVVIVDRCINWNDDRNRNAWITLVHSCRQRGITIPNDEPFGVTQFPFNAEDVDRFVNTRFARFQSLKNLMPMFIVIMPNNAGIYQAFKGICELRFGIRSQMIKKETFLNKLVKECERGGGPMSSAVARNIFLKINSKCGGVNCKITPTPNDNWTKFVGRNNSTLFIGIDVTHPAPGDTESPSISALVGNIDLDATRFTATVRAQTHRTEWIEAMEEMFDDRLKHFEKGMQMFQKERFAPSKIIVFRDGVSESQFEGLMDFECTAMRQAIKKRYNGKHTPKLTILVVQKRHNTRFFDRNDRDQKNKGNLQPGTVIDGYVTSHQKEFYLCSHKGMLGTSRPAHYFILLDENNFTPDDLEICSNNLCYLFARAPMPVSIPAPVYYAHLACYRARHHWAAADDNLRVGENGQPLAKDRDDRIIEPNRAVIVNQELRPSMYFS